jgi:hypothetical protein
MVDKISIPNDKFHFLLDVDKNGYIDQSEIDIMAKVLSNNKNEKIPIKKFHFFCSMYYEC